MHYNHKRRKKPPSIEVKLMVQTVLLISKLSNIIYQNEERETLLKIYNLILKTSHHSYRKEFIDSPGSLVFIYNMKSKISL